MKKTVKKIFSILAVVTVIALNFTYASQIKAADSTPPLGYIRIGGYYNWATQLPVTLNLATADNIDDPENIQMMISNQSNFSGATWESFSQTKSWILPDPGTDEAEIPVYVKFKDSNGNVSRVYSETAHYYTGGFGCGGDFEIPVYRFWSDNYRAHFYTANETEKQDVKNNNPNWEYEWPVYNVYTGPCGGYKPIYRFWSEKHKAHFYTNSEMERLEVLARYPESTWKYERLEYWTIHPSTPGAKPVYRFWSDVYGAHFYTSDPQEKQDVQNNNPNWRYEWIAFYVK
jgi:hypothetical protein